MTERQAHAELAAIVDRYNILYQVHPDTPQSQCDTYAYIYKVFVDGKDASSKGLLGDTAYMRTHWAEFLRKVQNTMNHSWEELEKRPEEIEKFCKMYPGLYFARRPEDRFQIVKLLCESMYGQVSLAKDRLSGRNVCVKLSRRATAQNRLYFEDPFTEVGVHRQLKHQHITKFIHHFERNGVLTTVSEYCEGGDLFNYIVGEYSAGRRIPEDQCRVFMGQLLRAVEYMHKAGFAHLDIKPENVLLVPVDGARGTKQFAVKLCDFGMARRLAFDKQHRVCYVRGSLGTPGYQTNMAYTGMPFDPCLQDVWSAGVVLFLMLTGVPPFTVASQSEKSYQNIIGHGKHGIAEQLNLWHIRGVSDAAIEVLSLMINIQNNQWLPGQLLQHPFFAEAPELQDMSATIDEVLLRQAKLVPPGNKPNRNTTEAKRMSSVESAVSDSDMTFMSPKKRKVHRFERDTDDADSDAASMASSSVQSIKTMDVSNASVLTIDSPIHASPVADATASPIRMSSPMAPAVKAMPPSIVHVETITLDNVNDDDDDDLL